MHFPYDLLCLVFHVLLIDWTQSIYTPTYPKESPRLSCRTRRRARLITYSLGYYVYLDVIHEKVYDPLENGVFEPSNRITPLC